MGANGGEALLDILIAAVNLLDVADHARAFGAECGDKKRDARPDVG